MREFEQRRTDEPIGTDDGGFLVVAMPEYRGCVEITIAGEIDLTNVDRFAERLDECVTVLESPSNWDFARRYVFDMSRVSFLDVDGSRVIVSVAAGLARRGARIEMRGTSRVQRRVIELLDEQGFLRSSST